MSRKYQGDDFNPLIYTDCKAVSDRDYIIAFLISTHSYTRIARGVVENSSTHLIPVFGFCEPHLRVLPEWSTLASFAQIG